MRLIQFNVYFSHHLHISVLSYITYIIHVHIYMFGLVLQFRHSELEQQRYFYSFTL